MKQTIRMNPLTLRFTGDLERLFQDNYFRASLAPARMAAVVGVPLYFAFSLLDKIIVPDVASQLIAIRSFVVILSAGLVAFSYMPNFKRWMQIVISSAMLVSGSSIIAMIHPLSQVGRHFNENRHFYTIHTGLILIMLFFYLLIRLQFIYATVVGWILVGLYLKVSLYYDPSYASYKLWNDMIHLSAANVIGMLGCYFLEQIHRDVFVQTRLLEAEQEKVVHLLLNILPKTAARQWNDDETSRIDYFSEVTVLYVDVANLEDLDPCSPEDDLSALNEIYSLLDRLSERHYLEKIRTIGDTFFVSGGADSELDESAKRCLEVAIAFQEELMRANITKRRPIRVRIGIHTGPVISGMIGNKKYVYDLWGDTVKMAGSIASAGSADGVYVSAESYERLKDDYQFEPRQLCSSKGNGGVLCYSFIGRRNPR